MEIQITRTDTKVLMTKNGEYWREVNLVHSRMDERTSVIFLYGIACLLGANPVDIEIDYSTIEPFNI